MKAKYGFIGCGHLGLAFVKSFIDNGFLKEDIFLSYSGRKSTYNKIMQMGLSDIISTNEFIFNNCDFVFLFVRPNQLENIFTPNIKESTIIISSIAGVSIQDLKKKFQREIIRIMPTNPDSIITGNSVCALFPEKAEIKTILYKNNIALNSISFEKEFHTFTALSVLPAIIVLSELLNAKIDIEEIMAEFNNYDSIISWGFKSYPKVLNENEKKDYIIKTATPGGITESMINDFRVNNKIINAIRSGIRRSQEIEKGSKP